MIIQQIDAAAEQAGRSHGMMQRAMTGLLAQSFDRPRAWSPDSYTKLRNALMNLAVESQMSILTAVFMVEKQIEKQAYLDAGAPYQPLEATEEAALLAGDIMMTLNADAIAVEKVWRRFALQVQLAMSSGLNETSAVIRLKYGQLATIKFVRADRSGKRWSTGVFSKNLVRGYLLATYVESYLHALTLKGVDVGVVAGLEPQHSHYGLHFSITGKTPGLPAFESIRDEIWHPNSNATVTHEPV